MEQKLFSVLPMSQRFSLEAGHTYSGSITISNSVNATEDFSYIVSVAPYSVINESYATDFVTASPYTQITNWITIENPTGTLSPNEHRAVNFTITVPENASAGGQYAALVVGENDNTIASNENVSVTNILELASVVYADVTGITTRNGVILDNTFPKFSFDNHITVSATIENKGNVHSDAIIAINVVNLVTGETIFPTIEGRDKFVEIIMPETTRLVTRSIDNLPPLGAVKISQTVYFNDIVSENQHTVIICPLWFIALVIFTVISVTTALIARHRHHHKPQYFVS